MWWQMSLIVILVMALERSVFRRIRKPNPSFKHTALTVLRICGLVLLFFVLYGGLLAVLSFITIVQRKG